MLKLLAAISLIYVMCKKPIEDIDYCTQLHHKLKTEWKQEGKITFWEHNKYWDFYYYNDGLKMAEMFQDTNYRKCFVKYTYDSIVKILGRPWNQMPKSYSYFFIEKPILDSLGIGNSIMISFDSNGYVEDIVKGRQQSID